MITVLDAPYTRDDVAGTFGAAGPWWQQLTDRRDPAAVAALAPIRRRIVDALAAYTRRADPTEDLDALGLAGRRRVQREPSDDSEGVDAGTTLAVLLDGVHEAGQMLRLAGALPARASGTVVQLSAGLGGVPKAAVPSAEFGPGGVVGDRQRTRRHHGRPWQAVCLWSAEVVDAFASAGHPIGYGAAGENVTVRGIDWAQVGAGVRVRLGDEVVLEASVFALPCAANARWFADGDFEHMHHDRGPVSRIYASVVRGGTVHAGDEAVLEP